MRGIAERDPAAFRAFYDKHAGLVHTVALRILRRRQDAEEVVEDVFWEIWEKSSRYDQTRSSPVTYLVTLTRSRCIDRTRRKGHRSMLTLDSLDTSAASASDTPADSASLDEQAQAVRAALAQLDENQRCAIQAAYFDGLSQTEIAEKMNKPLGTVKTYVRQGLIRLRQFLRTTDDQGPG
jgi:RNA polymerase sigma-70 factor (ECF subfamily)